MQFLGGCLRFFLNILHAMHILEVCVLCPEHGVMVAGSGKDQAVCHGKFTQKVERKYNAAWIYKRAQGQGHIQRIEGLALLMAELSEHVMVLDLLPIGAPRRNWKQTLVSDGMIIVRHPDLQKTLEIADRFGTELRMYAG